MPAFWKHVQSVYARYKMAEDATRISTAESREIPNAGVVDELLVAHSAANGLTILTEDYRTLWPRAQSRQVPVWTADDQRQLLLPVVLHHEVMLLNR